MRGLCTLIVLLVLTTCTASAETQLRSSLKAGEIKLRSGVVVKSVGVISSATAYKAHVEEKRKQFEQVAKRMSEGLLSKTPSTDSKPDMAESSPVTDTWKNEITIVRDRRGKRLQRICDDYAGLVLQTRSRVFSSKLKKVIVKVDDPQEGDTETCEYRIEKRVVITGLDGAALPRVRIDAQWTDVGSLGKVLTALLSIERRFDIAPDIMSLQIIVPTKVNDTVALGKYLMAAAKSIYATKQLQSFAIRFYALPHGSAPGRVRYPGRSVLAFRATSGEIHMLEAMQPMLSLGKSKNGKPYIHEYVSISAFNINLAKSVAAVFGPDATNAKKALDEYNKRGIYDDARGLFEVAGKFAAETYAIKAVSIFSRGAFPGKRSGAARGITSGLRVPVFFQKRDGKWNIRKPAKPK